MTPYTTPNKVMDKINKENIESRKIHVDDLPPCEKIPGKLTAGFKEHLDSLKEDCLTSANWSGARNQTHHAIKQHTIDKIIVLGSAGIFSHTSDHLFWQHELTFILAIFELVEQQAQVRKTKAPELIFQDPAFVAADRRLLNGLGGIVVEDPLAFMLIDEHTLVFAKHIPVVLQFTGLFQTCPAVCVSTNLKQPIECALMLQNKWCDFGPGFDIRGAGERFMVNRKAVDLGKAMLRLYKDIPGHDLDNFLANMAVFWLASEEGEKVIVREEKQMGSLGKKAKKWLDSL